LCEQFKLDLETYHTVLKRTSKMPRPSTMNTSELSILGLFRGMSIHIEAVLGMQDRRNQRTSRHTVQSCPLVVVVVSSVVLSLDLMTKQLSSGEGIRKECGEPNILYGKRRLLMQLQDL
jgi:hypothetical protein